MLKLARVALPSIPERTTVTCIALGLEGDVLVCGTSSGRLYVYHLRPMRLFKVISLPRAHDVTAMCFCPWRPDTFAVGTSKGHVFVGKVDSKEEFKASTISKAYTDYNSPVTAVNWAQLPSSSALAAATSSLASSSTALASSMGVASSDAAAAFSSTSASSSAPTSKSSLLLVGDMDGVVRLLKPFGFIGSSERVVLKCKTQVVQLQVQNDVVAVSTLVRGYVLPLHRKPRKVMDVGKKLRDGQFGICFDSRSAGAYALCARPGKRLWLADVSNGQVHSTLKVKLPPPSSLSPYNARVEHDDPALQVPAKSVQFRMLKACARTNDLVCFGTKHGLFFIDPEQVCISHWFPQFQRISCVEIDERHAEHYGTRMYVLHNNVLSCLIRLVPAAFLGDVLGVPAYRERLALEGDFPVASSRPVCWGSQRMVMNAHGIVQTLLQCNVVERVVLEAVQMMLEETDESGNTPVIAAESISHINHLIMTSVDSLGSMWQVDDGRDVSLGVANSSVNVAMEDASTPPDPRNQETKNMRVNVHSLHRESSSVGSDGKHRDQSKGSGVFAPAVYRLENADQLESAVPSRARIVPLSMDVEETKVTSYEWIVRHRQVTHSNLHTVLDMNDDEKAGKDLHASTESTESKRRVEEEVAVEEEAQVSTGQDPAQTKVLMQHIDESADTQQNVSQQGFRDAATEGNSVNSAAPVWFSQTCSEFVNWEDWLDFRDCDRSGMTAEEEGEFHQLLPIAEGVFIAYFALGQLNLHGARNFAADKCQLAIVEVDRALLLPHLEKHMEFLRAWLCEFIDCLSSMFLEDTIMRSELKSASGEGGLSHRLIRDEPWKKAVGKAVDMLDHLESDKTKSFEYISAVQRVRSELQSLLETFFYVRMQQYRHNPLPTDAWTQTHALMFFETFLPFLDAAKFYSSCMACRVHNVVQMSEVLAIISEEHRMVRSKVTELVNAHNIDVALEVLDTTQDYLLVCSLLSAMIDIDAARVLGFCAKRLSRFAEEEHATCVRQSNVGLLPWLILRTLHVEPVVRNLLSGDVKGVLYAASAFTTEKHDNKLDTAPSQEEAFRVNLYVKYLSDLMKHNTCARSDKRLVHEWARLCLCVGYESSKETKVSWPLANTVNEVFADVHNAVYSSDEEHLLSLAKEFGYIHGLKELYLHSCIPLDVTGCLDLAFDTDDRKFLEKFMRILYTVDVLAAADAWIEISKRATGSTSISTTYVMRLMANMFGARKLLQSLADSCEMRQSLLSSVDDCEVFLQELVDTHVLQQQASVLQKHIFEVLSQRGKGMAAYAAHSLDWSIRLFKNGAPCQECKQPLQWRSKATTERDVGGILVMQCGHCLHEHCAPNGGCPVCFRASLA